MTQSYQALIEIVTRSHRRASAPPTPTPAPPPDARRGGDSLAYLEGLIRLAITESTQCSAVVAAELYPSPGPPRPETSLDDRTVMVHAHSDDADCLLALAGAVDARAVARIADDATRIVTDATAARVMVDLSRVTFMDAAGLGLLARLRNTALIKGDPVCLLGVPPSIDRLLVLGGLAEVFGRANAPERC